MAAHSARRVLLKNMLALDLLWCCLQSLESNFEINHKIGCEMGESTISQPSADVVATESGVVAAETGY